MERPNSDSDAAAPQRVVFVDTSFDTHLALAVSDSDTVLDLKKKTIQAHQLCFPKFGEIRIDTVKVKRRGHSYHLFDSMHVISAFHGVKKNWFVSVDASSLVERLPCPAVDGEPSNAIVEMGQPRYVLKTVDVALGDLNFAAESHRNDGSNGESLSPTVKRSRLRDEGSPSEISKKRRKMKSQASDPSSSAAATRPHYGDNDESFVQKTDAGMNEPDADKRKGQIAADFVDGNGHLPLALKERVKEMDVGIPSVGDVALIINQVSETGHVEMNVILEGHDNQVSVAHAVDTVKNVENVVSPKRRKKSIKSRSSAGEKLDIVNPESQEVSFDYNSLSLVESRKAVNSDQPEERLNEKNNLPEGEGSDIVLMDADKASRDEPGIGQGLSQEITENAEAIDKEMKTGNESRNTKDKSVDQTSDQQPNEVPIDEMESLQHISGKAGVEESAEGKILKKKSRKRSSKETKDDQSNDKAGKDRGYLSQADGGDIQTVDTDDMEHGNEIEQSTQITQKSVDAGKLKEEMKKRTTRRSLRLMNSEKVDTEVNNADDQVNDSDADKKKCKIAMDVVEENGSLPHVDKEHLKETDGVIPSAGVVALVHNQVSETSHPVETQILPGSDADVGIGEVSVVSTRRRRKSSKAKSSAGEKQGITNPENHEGSLGIVNPENRLNDKNDLSKVGSEEISIMDANKESGREHEVQKGPSREIAENADVVGEKARKHRTPDEKNVDPASDQNQNEEHMNEMRSLQHISDKASVGGYVEENITKKKTRKRSSKEKKDDQSNDKIGRDLIYSFQAAGRDVQDVDAADKEQGNEMGQPLQITQKSSGPGYLNEETKNMTTRRRRRAKNVDTVDETEANSSYADGQRLMAIVAADDKPYEQSRNEMEQTHLVTEKSTHADKDMNKSQKKSASQSSKDKNVKQSTGGIDEAVMYSVAENGEAVVTAALEGISYELNGNRIAQLSELTEKSAHAEVGKEKRKRKTTRQSSKEKIADQSSDRISKDQSCLPPEERELMAASKKSGEDGNKGQSSLQNFEKLAEADNNADKMPEKTEDRDSNDKDFDQSDKITQEENRRHSQGVPREKFIVPADRNSNQELADNNQKLDGKRSKSKKSSKKNAQSDKETEELTSSHSTWKEDTSNLGNAAKSATGKKSEAKGSIPGTSDRVLGSHSPTKAVLGTTNRGSSTLAPVQSLEANNQSLPLHEATDDRLPGNRDDVNNLVNELLGGENINFRDYFAPRLSQQEVASSGKSAVKEGLKEGRAGSGRKVKSGKRKPASSALTSALGEEGSVFSNSSNLKSPVKKLRKASGNQDAGSPKPKVVTHNAILGTDGENSATITSGLKLSKKPASDNENDSSVDHYRVAIRKPPNKNMGESTDRSARKRSLFSSPAIFTEESSESSKHGGDENSDASTRTPSDKLLSDYSDSDSDRNDSKMNEDSTRGGRYGKGKSSFKDEKRLSFKEIFKSSSGYNKTRQVAASQIEETESQLVDFVPDSQTNL